MDHHDKLLLDVYDENRMTRDDFLGRAEIDTSTATTSNCYRNIGKRWKIDQILIFFASFLKSDRFMFFLIADLEKRSSKSNVTGRIIVIYSVLPSSTETSHSQQTSAQDSFLDIFESIIRSERSKSFLV